VVVGKPSLTNSGGAYVFVEPPGGWANMTQTASCLHRMVRPTIIFARLCSRTAIWRWSARCSPPSVMRTRKAPRMFSSNRRKVGTTSKFNQRVIAKDKAVSLFGASASMSGKTAVIGAPYTSLGTNPNQGAAYVFSQR
jgi:hypothetical protein